MIKIIVAFMLLAPPALAQTPVTGCLGPLGYASECPSPPEGRQIGNWRGYQPEAGVPNDVQPWAIDGREHVLMLGGAWGVPIKLICERPEDSIGNVNDEVKCIDRQNKAYSPTFERPSGNSWVLCNPYDSSGYNSCSPSKSER